MGGASAVVGTIQTLAESSTVLVFHPSRALPASAKVVVAVGPGATSLLGVPLVKAASATVTTVAAPKPKAATTHRTTTTSHTTKPIP